MAIAHRARRREDTSNWLLTSFTISLAAHVLLMHVLGGVHLLDVEVFTSSVSRWFNVVEAPETVSPELTTDSSVAVRRAERPAVPHPEEAPLLEPSADDLKPSLGNETDLAPPGREPVRARLPHTELRVVHADGSGGIEQTNADLGKIAPVRHPALDTRPAPSGTGRRVAKGLPGLPSPAPAALDLPEPATPRPAARSHAGELAAPETKPDATPVAIGEAPPAGIIIPLDDPLGTEPVEIPQYVLAPEPPRGDPRERRVIPFGKEVHVRTDMYAEPGDPRLYFRLEIAVAEPEKLPVVPKDVLFVCDVSLSMRPGELKQSRKAIVEYLRQLSSTDRFNVVVFSEVPRKLFPDFVEPTAERIEAAGEFIERIPGLPRTDVYRVLRAVVRDIAQQTLRNRPTSVFFLSDGRSTSGIRDARRIVNEISALAPPNVAIFPFDAGRHGNRYLLDLLAYRSRGTVSYTDDVDEADTVQGQLFRSLDKPVLMKVQPTFTNLKVDETYPASLPNLYTDRPIVIYGRCTPGQNVTIRLQGQNPYAPRALEYRATPGSPDPGRQDIAREWARRKIHHLVSDMVRFGETPERRAEIELLGKKYNLRTLYRE
jgi:hypothetical protein